MKGAGFDYEPVPYGGAAVREPNPGLARAGQLLVPHLDVDRANVAIWGYGIDPDDWEEELFTPPGADPEAAEAAARNDAYRASLSAAAQEEYATALAGPADQEGRRSDPSGQGCAAKARSEVPDVALAPGGTEQFFEAHEAVLWEMAELTKWDVGMDPRSVRLDQEWAACAVGKGLDFSVVLPEGEDGGGTDASMANRPSPALAIEVAAALGEDGKPIDLDSADPYLRAYPAQVEVALIDFDCRQEVDYMNRIMEIQFDLERQFADKNRDRLEAMKADATKEG
jgi:hypothetical protein